MNRKKALLLIMTVVMGAGLIQFQSCRKSYLDNYIPRIEIAGSPSVKDYEVEFKARIINPNKHKINAYGFEWSEKRNRNLIIGRTRIEAADFDKNTFSESVDYALNPGEEYNIVAFIETSSQIIHSAIDGFTPKGSYPPVVDDYYAKEGKAGDTLVILGSRFPSINHHERIGTGWPSRITFGTITAIALSTSCDRIVVQVPQNYSSSSYSQMKLEVPGHSVVIGGFTYIE